MLPSMAAAASLKVLWATDCSPNSEAAIPLLRQMVLPAAASLAVVTVAPHAVISGARPDPAFLKGASPAARRHALIEARRAAESAITGLDPAVPVEIITKWGHPIEEILRAATRLRADLIVMAAKGHSDLHLIFLGSVSQGVAHNTLRPILIARPGAHEVRKVVVGYHGTPSAKRALAFLGRLALPAEAEIVLVTAVEPFTMPEGMPPAYRSEALRESYAINEERRKKASTALSALATEIEAGGRKVSTEVESGNAADVLDEATKRHDAQLLVLGSRRPRPEGNLLLGTTAERLMRHSPVSVLLVR
jgi:nucleotide-binding universal stress UspA family protein